MKKILFILLLFAGVSLAQTPVFSSKRDTSRISDATKVTGTLIEFNNPWEGAGSLFVTGDSVSGTTGVVTVGFILFYGLALDDTGDSLWSEEFTLGTVAATLQKETLGDGSLTGETFDVGADTEFKESLGVKFTFVGTGTQETNILSRYKIGK